MALIKFELDPKFLPDVLALNKRFPDLAIQDVTKKEQMAEKETTKTKPSFAIQINIAAIRDHLLPLLRKKVEEEPEYFIQYQDRISFSRDTLFMFNRTKKNR